MKRVHNPELEIAVYTALENRAADLRSKNTGELNLVAGELQKEIGAPGRIREICALLENDPLVSKAGLELKERSDPRAALATVFRYKIHGVL